MNPGTMAAYRRRAFALMDSRIWITGPTKKVTDPATGAIVEVPGPDRYGTQTKPAPAQIVRAGGTAVLDVVAGGQDLGIRPYDVKVPWDTTGPERGDEVHVISSGDPALVGRTLILADPVMGRDHMVHRRMVAILHI